MAYAHRPGPAAGGADDYTRVAARVHLRVTELKENQEVMSEPQMLHGPSRGERLGAGDVSGAGRRIGNGSARLRANRDRRLRRRHGTVAVIRNGLGAR